MSTFMFGTADLCVKGIDEEGRETLIMEDGLFTEPFACCKLIAGKVVCFSDKW